MIANKAKEISQKINELISGKADELAAIDAEIVKADEDAEKAREAARTATEATDINAYEKARSALYNAQTRLEMYRARRMMLEQKDFVSEAESDAVIDDLLKYEADIKAEFEDAVRPHIDELRRLYNEYRQNVVDAETVITTWTSSIRANRRTFGTTTYADGTSVSPEAVPVHRAVYLGGDVAERIYSFLKKWET